MDLYDIKLAASFLGFMGAFTLALNLAPMVAAIMFVALVFVAPVVLIAYVVWGTRRSVRNAQTAVDAANARADRIVFYPARYVR